MGYIQTIFGSYWDDIGDFFGAIGMIWDDIWMKKWW